MIRHFIQQSVKTTGTRTFLSRMIVVGGNFIIMIGLAALLGLERFGALSVAWGMTLVMSTCVSVGGPLSLLRDLTNGSRPDPQSLIAQIVIYPAMVAVLCLWALPTWLPAIPWWMIVPVGFAINAASCAASLARALGSVQVSMVLRDGGPQIALGVAGLMVLAQPDLPITSILGTAGLILAGMTFASLVHSVRHKDFAAIVQRNGERIGVQYGLWGTSVLGMLLAQVDIIVGGRFLNADQIGLYALLKRVANLVALPVSVATWVTSPDISAAFGSRDHVRLRRASMRGSQVALVPGLVLLTSAIGFAPFLPEGHGIYLILLTGALMQVVFASTFTVATLCNGAAYSAAARVISICVYLLIAVFMGPQLSASVNALAYVTGMTLGCLALWGLVRDRLGVDTSAVVLWRRGAFAWRTS